MLTFKMKQFPTLCLVSVSMAQQQVRSHNNTVETGMRTQCKTCPYSLCTNTAAYESPQSLTLTCWTRGTAIDSDRTWLRTTDNCYVTQYDLTDYAGTYENDLPYCGKDSEEEFYTTQQARTKYNTECNIVPSINSDNIHYHKYGKDLTVTCYAENEQLIIDDATWFKTTDNCYVAQTGLTEEPDKDELDPCGPIPFLELNATYAEPVDPDRALQKSSHFSATLHQPPQAADNLQKRYLVNVTVGEDYALCHSEASSNSTVEKRYRWLQEVFLQCLVWNDMGFVDNETFWSLTTDFCYVRSVDLWQSPEGDHYRFPLCEWFT